MSENRVLQIRESINLAREQERETKRLQSFVEAKIPALHHAISLPEQGAAQHLMNFVTDYIEHVPDCIQALKSHCAQAQLDKFCDVFINIIEDYFISPPELIRQHDGLHALIDEAYLAHRLIEELNDRLMMLCGTPLIPMDMTLSNIIVHDLIGEEFANQLDLAVHFSIEMVFNSGDFSADGAICKFVNEQSEHWDETLQKWPCLAGDSSITLSLASDSELIALREDESSSLIH